MFEGSISLWTSMNSWFTPTVFFVLLNLMIGTIVITSSLGSQKRHDTNRSDYQNQQQVPQLARSPSMLQRLKSIHLYSYSHSPQDSTVGFQQQQPPDIHTLATSEHIQPQFIARSPSLLQRLKSINLYHYLPGSEPLSSQTETSYNLPRERVQEQERSSKEEVHVEDEDYDVQEDPLEQEPHEQTLDEIYGQLQASGSHVKRSQSDTKPASGEVLPKLSRKMKKSASSKSAFSHFKEEEVVETEGRRPATVREGKVSVMEADEEVDAKADDFINRFKQQLKLQRLDSIMRYKDMIGRMSPSAK